MKAKATIEDLIAAKSGDAEAVRKVWTALRPLAVRCAARYPVSVRRDLIQEAFCAVGEAIKATKFKANSDPEREWGRFVCYAERWITGRVFRVAVVSREWIDRDKVGIDAAENVEGVSMVFDGFPVTHYGLMFAFCRLTPRERRVLSQRFVERMTIREIAVANRMATVTVLGMIDSVFTKMRDDIRFAQAWSREAKLISSRVE